MSEENSELGHNQVPFIRSSRWLPLGDTGELAGLSGRPFSLLLESGGLG